MAHVNKRILKSYVILCEGIDAQKFLISYLNSEALKYDKRFGNNIQVLNFEGITQLGTYILNLKNMDGYEIIKQLLVVRDAETSVQSAIDSIQHAFTVSGLPVPNKCNKWESDDRMKTAFSLFPLCSSNPSPGALEDLCWYILNNDDSCEMRNEINEFVRKVKEKYHSIVSHEHKSRLHTFFSVNERLVSLKIGESADAKAFDWNSPKLNSLKTIIEDGF